MNEDKVLLCVGRVDLFGFSDGGLVTMYFYFPDFTLRGVFFQLDAVQTQSSRANHHAQEEETGYKGGGGGGGIGT